MLKIYFIYMAEEYGEVNKNIASLSTLGYNAVWIGNELVQEMVRAGTVDYNTAIGHLSDLAFPGVITSWALLATANKSKTTQRLASLAVPASLTIYEFFPFLDGSTTFDWYDIPCYFVGSTLAYAGVKLGSSKENRKKVYTFLDRINLIRHLRKKSDSLDDLL
jgi:hypothetical protein